LAGGAETVHTTCIQLTCREDSEFLCSLSWPQTLDLRERQTLSYDELCSTTACQHTNNALVNQLQRKPDCILSHIIVSAITDKPSLPRHPTSLYQLWCNSIFEGNLS